MNLDIVSFGEAMPLLAADRTGPIKDAQSFLKCLAGTETDVAIGLSRLGLRVGWVSRVSTDSMARNSSIEGAHKALHMFALGVLNPWSI